MTKLQTFPVQFEIYEEGDELAAKVIVFDAESATVEIKALQDKDSWKPLSEEIQKCLELMKSGV